jgi:hypothetical protein
VTIPAASSGVDVQDEGSPVTGNPHATINFVGSGVTATDVAGVATITVPVGITLQDEGSPVTGNPHATLNFVGAGVAATDVAGVGTITIPGGITVQDEGVGIANNPHGTLNFVGSSVTATDVAGVATITVTGGGAPMFDTTLTPAALTATTDNWNPGTLGQTTLIRCTTNGLDQIVNGMVGGVDGKVVCFLNVNATSSVLVNLAAEAGSSTAANRFRAAFICGGCLYIYDGGLQRWCLITG